MPLHRSEFPKPAVVAFPASGEIGTSYRRARSLEVPICDFIGVLARVAAMRGISNAVRARTNSLHARHDLPFDLPRTPRSVAGLYRHGDLRRHAAAADPAVRGRRGCDGCDLDADARAQSARSPGADVGSRRHSAGNADLS